MMDYSKFNVLKDNNFRRLFLSQAMSTLGDSVYRIILIYVAYSLGGAILIGYVFTAQTLTIALAVLFAGSLTKYFSANKILIVSSLIRALVTLIVLIIVFLQLNNFLLLVSIGVLFGISDSLYRPAFYEILKQNIVTNMNEESVSLITISRQLINVIGPIIGGLFLELFSEKVSIIIIITIYLLAAVFAYGLKANMQLKPKESKIIDSSIMKDLFIEIRDGFKYIYNTKWLKIGMIISFFFVPIQQALSTVVVPVFALNLDNRPITYSLVLSAYAIGAFIGGVIFLYIGKKISKLQTVLNLLLLGYFIYSLSGFVYEVFWAAAISLVVGLFVQLYSVAWENLTVTHVKEEYIARISSVSWFIFSVLSPISITLFSFLVDLYGSRLIITIAPLISCSIIIILIVLLKVNTITFREDSKTG